MARRTAQELINQVSGIMGTAEGVENLLEDIADSVGDVDLSNYVTTDQYNAVVTERDAAVKARDEFRDRYINRFYQNYDKPNDVGYIMSQAPQSQIEEAEKIDWYSRLFE